MKLREFAAVFSLRILLVDNCTYMYYNTINRYFKWRIDLIIWKIIFLLR